MTAGADPERLARAGLSAAAEPDDTTVRALVDEFGAERAWRRLRDPLRASGLEPARGRALAADPVADLRLIGKLGGRFLVPGDPEWPAALDALVARGDPPYGLWVRGPASLAELSAAVAVVGARAATAYGCTVAAEIAAEVADAGWAVVSGAAYGIDGAAHRGALGIRGTTVAVLACGVDVAYPKGHATLIERVLETGAVVSELPPGAAPMRHRFLTRNRLIAALAAGTVVVEAAGRSGATTTARHADELSRVVMAVPGPVTSAMSAGCHALIRDRGAVLVTGAGDVLDAVAPLGAGSGAARAPHDGREEPDAVDRRLLGAVPARRAATGVRIAEAAGVEPREALGRLADLAAAGLVRRTDDGWRRVEPPP